MNQYDMIFDLEINVGHCDLYFMSSDYPYILNSIGWTNVILLENESL